MLGPDPAVGRTLHWRYLGVLPYRQAWELQRGLRARRLADEIGDQLLLLQHPSVITLGRNRGEESLLASASELERSGTELIRSDRGGDATWHGPGQLVGYLVVHLDAARLGVRGFVKRVAGALVSYLGELGIEAAWDESVPGVWVGAAKIGALGFSVHRGVTNHGFALNLDPDLTAYRRLVPCGLPERSVTSAARLLHCS